MPAPLPNPPQCLGHSLAHSLEQAAARWPQGPAYHVRDAHGWQATSWAQLLQQVQRAARALVALQLQPGQTVCVLGFNRPEWLVMAHAAAMVGARLAGIYWTSSASEVAYIVGHARCALLLAEDGAQVAKLAGLAQPPQVVVMAGPPVPNTLAWDPFLHRGDDLRLQAEVTQRLAALDPQSTAVLIYTSGTTGPPKAVMLSHAALAWAAQALVDLFGSDPHGRQISFLPMAHVAEMVGSIHAPVRRGSAIFFARSLDSLPEHLKEVRPTLFFGVPRVWEKMHAALSQRLAAATGWKGRLARDAMQVARRWHAADLAGRRPGPWLRLRMHLARRLVLGKVHAALGLDQARLLISGAAPIAADKLTFFCGLDLVVRELYGQSEIGGPTTLSLPGSTRIGSVGKPVPGLEVRIADDGEILVRGPSLFQGYAGDPEASAAALAGGWLHSGDLGRFDADGFLYITGRKKDLIITSGGKNLSPANLEADLMALPLVEYAVVVGDGRHFLSALLTLDREALAEFGRRHQLPADGLAAHPRVRQALQDGIDAINAQHARVAGIRRFSVLQEPLSIARGELTPTLKVRRAVVMRVHADAIEAMYRD